MAKLPSDTQILLPLQDWEMADSLASQSGAMLRCLQLVDEVSPSTVPVMISGEVGTGKSLLARFIHSKSSNRKGQCLSLRCGNLGGDELKSRLFGGTAGAAANQPGGLLAAVAGGTLVLDGVDAMPGRGQRELLNVLRGGARSWLEGVRILSTVGAGMDAGNTFSEELAYILAESIVRIPPLRERREDIGALAERALRDANMEHGRNVRKFSPGVRDFLRHYEYPGNVRELFVIVGQAVRQCRSDTLFVEDFGLVTAEAPTEGGDGRFLASPLLPLEEVEKRHINMVLLRTGWKKSAAARALHISETMLNRKIKLYRLEREQ